MKFLGWSDPKVQELNLRSQQAAPYGSRDLRFEVLQERTAPWTTAGDVSAALRSTHLPTPPTHTHQPRGVRTVAVALQAEAPRSLFCAHMDPVCRDTGTCFSARTQKPEVFARGLVRANKHRWSAPCPHADAAVDNQMRAKARRNSCAPCWPAAVCVLGVYVASTLASNALWARHGGPLQWRAAACSQQSRGAMCGAATSTARAHHDAPVCGAWPHNHTFMRCTASAASGQARGSAAMACHRMLATVARFHVRGRNEYGARAPCRSPVCRAPDDQCLQQGSSHFSKRAGRESQYRRASWALRRRQHSCPCSCASWLSCEGRSARVLAMQHLVRCRKMTSRHKCHKSRTRFSRSEKLR